MLPTHVGTIVASQRGTAQPSHSHMPRIHRGIQGHRSALVVGWVNKNGTLFFILFIAWERWEELVSRLGNLSWELGGLGSSFPDHALGPNWDSGIGTHHMLTAPFGRPIGEQNHCLQLLPKPSEARGSEQVCLRLSSAGRLAPARGAPGLPSIYPH